MSDTFVAYGDGMDVYPFVRYKVTPIGGSYSVDRLVTHRHGGGRRLHLGCFNSYEAAAVVARSRADGERERLALDPPETERPMIVGQHPIDPRNCTVALDAVRGFLPEGAGVEID